MSEAKYTGGGDPEQQKGEGTGAVNWRVQAVWVQAEVRQTEVVQTKGPSVPDDQTTGGSGGTDSRRGTLFGGVAIDTTYPRSIEGILKLVTVVSRTTTVLFV